MTLKRDGIPLYTLAKNRSTGKRELKSTTRLNALAFGNALRTQGYAVTHIFSEADYKRAVNKAAIKGFASLTPKEIHIHDTYPDILSGRFTQQPAQPERSFSHA